MVEVNVFLVQVLFAALYLATEALVMLLYARSAAVPPYVHALLAISKRIHSIYVLRLFNDCWTMLLAYVAVLLLTQRRYAAAVPMFSLAVSTKMNVLLLAPGVLAACLLVLPSQAPTVILSADTLHNSCDHCIARHQSIPPSIYSVGARWLVVWLVVWLWRPLAVAGGVAARRIHATMHRRGCPSACCLLQRSGMCARRYRRMLCRGPAWRHWPGASGRGSCCSWAWQRRSSCMRQPRTSPAPLSSQGVAVRPACHTHAPPPSVS